MLPCSAAHCSEDIVRESWVSSVSAGQRALPFVIFVRLSDMFGARSHGPVDNKPAKPTQNFSWMTASALTTLLEPRVAPQMCFSQTIFKGPAQHGAAQIRWVSMDLASAQLDCLLHGLGAAVSKTCSQTIQFPPCFGIAVFRSLV